MSKEEEKKKKAQKRKPLEDEIEQLRKKRKQVELDGKQMRADSIKAYERAECNVSMSLLSKGNAFRKAADQKLIEQQNIQKLIDEKEIELSNM